MDMLHEALGVMIKGSDALARVEEAVGAHLRSGRDAVADE